MLSLAGLELSVGFAGERERALAHTPTGLASAVIDDESLPVGEEVDDDDASLTPWLTR